METGTIKETIMLRGWRDTKRFHSSPIVWLGEAVLGAITTVSSQNPFAFPVAIFLLFSGTFVWFTLRAPLVQRNEARQIADDVYQRMLELENEIRNPANKGFSIRLDILAVIWGGVTNRMPGVPLGMQVRIYNTGSKPTILENWSCIAELENSSYEVKLGHFDNLEMHVEGHGSLILNWEDSIFEKTQKPLAVGDAVTGCLFSMVDEEYRDQFMADFNLVFSFSDTIGQRYTLTKEVSSQLGIHSGTSEEERERLLAARKRQLEEAFSDQSAGSGVDLEEIDGVDERPT